MDRVLIERKLESHRRCVARVETKRPPTLAALVADVDAQDILVLNLSRAIQLCVDLATHLLTGSEQPAPASMGETFTRLADAAVIDTELARRLRGAVGFRNIAVHNYTVMDWAIVFAISYAAPHEFAEFARSVSARLLPARG